MDIYIANLRKGVSVERLRQTFGHLGDVSSVRIIFAKEEKHERDFAVISLAPSYRVQMERPLSDSTMTYAVAV
jgi:hypothetical protein